MCSSPVQIDPETQVSCRKCDECLASRRGDWVLRAMAEKSINAECLLIRLSIRNNPDGSKPAAARVFKYRDVQNFFKSLRKSYKDRYGLTGDLRYIVCGEQGSRRGRVHWHCVLFSGKPLPALGSWSDLKGNPAQYVEDENLHWSLWPHGHVYCQTPNEGGMAYVLKYAMKDQFNVVQSRGHARETRAENHSASMFRMSKKPPIGWRYFEQLTQRWEELGVVPPSLEIKIPEASGYYYPSGLIREYLLQRIHDINETHRQQHGKDTLQWSTLLHSLSLNDNNTKDLETLLYGTLETETPQERPQALELYQHRKQRARATAQIVQRCSGFSPCAECLAALDADTLASFELSKAESYAAFAKTRDAPTFDAFEAWARGGKVPSQWCQLQNLPESQSAFQNARAIGDLRARLEGKHSRE